MPREARGSARPPQTPRRRRAPTGSSLRLVLTLVLLKPTFIGELACALVEALEELAPRGVVRTRDPVSAVLLDAIHAQAGAHLLTRLADLPRVVLTRRVLERGAGGERHSPPRSEC